MKLKVHRRINSKGKTEIEHLEIKSSKVISFNSSLLLVREDEMGVEVIDKEEQTGTLHDRLVIHKVQFVASCKTKLENELIVAFYSGEYPEQLEAHVIAGLPITYSAEASSIYVLDYKGYLDICELTGESKLSFIDYYTAKQKGDLEINTLLMHNGKSLNREGQKELHGI